MPQKKKKQRENIVSMPILFYLIDMRYCFENKRKFFS